MFGFSRLFRSRWAALLWAAGVFYSAYSFAGNAPGASQADDLSAANNIVNPVL